MHVCKQDIERDAEIVQVFPLCRKDFGDYREIKIEKEIQYLENNTDNVENKDIVSFRFSFGNALHFLWKYCKAYVHRG